MESNDAEWTVSVRERQAWWLEKEYEWGYHILYKGLEQLTALGAIPLALLIYYNLRIYSAIKMPPDIELQAEEEIASINREKKFAKVLIGIVIVFNICHSPRIIWHIYNAYNYKSIVNCPMHYPKTTGQSPWALVLGFMYDLFLVINSSVNTIVYCAINERFRYHMLCFLRTPYQKIMQYVNTSRRNSITSV